jgi:hypothetical protein
VAPVGLLAQFAPEMEIKVFGILVLARHARVESGEPVPADAPLDLLHRFFFSDQDPHGLAVHGIASLQLSDGEGG